MEPEEKPMNKEDLWREAYPPVPALEEIPWIVREGEDRLDLIKSKCISLKRLFKREQMDAHHVDCLILYQIALRLLQILQELRDRHVYPGLFDLADIYVDLGKGPEIWILRPERFQLAGFEQDYEWYPEDVRVFPDTVLFDEKSQLLADTRLIYKVLVASARGNVKIPPRQTDIDYSYLFYKTLPPSLKEVFSRDEPVSHDHLRALINEALALEKEGAQVVREKQNERTIKKYKESQKWKESDEWKQKGEGPGESEEIYTAFVLLRTETGHSGKISKLIYQEQDRLELESGLSRSVSHQAFVYGNGFVEARDFRVYPLGFRVECQQAIRDYSSAEAMIIAGELVRASMEKKEDSHRIHRICLITDGRLKNDRAFQQALDGLKELKDRGCVISFLHYPEDQCDACSKLAALASDKGA